MTSQHPDYIARLMILHLQDKLNDAQKDELAAYYAAHPSMKDCTDHPDAARKALNELALMQQFDADSGWHNLMKKKAPVVRIHRAVIWAAASVVALFSIIFMLQRGGQEQQLAATGDVKPLERVTLTLNNGQTIAVDTLSDGMLGGLMLSSSDDQLKIEGASDMAAQDRSDAWNTLKVPYKKTFRLMLADGTRVFLNAGAELSFPDAFAAGDRRVSLIGEGYFEVQADEARPFIVALDALEVKAVGTAFNIHAYEDEGRVTTSLLSGKLIMIPASGAATSLDPGHEAIFNKADLSITVQPLAPSDATAWTRGTLEFKDETLASIFKKIGRWYHIRVSIPDEKVAGQRFTGKMQMYDELQDILRKFEKTDNLQFGLKNRDLTVTKKK